MLVAALAAMTFPAPAHAQVALKLDCIISSGEGDCTATGVVRGVVLVSEAVHLTFTTDSACPLQSAFGRMTGPFTADFNWVRVAAAGNMTTTGDILTFGPMVFSAPCPAVVESVTIVLGGI